MAADTNGLLPLLTPAAPGLDIHADQAPRIIAACVTLIVLSGVSVVLRFIARLLSRAGFWWDDWFILLATLFSWGCCISMIVSTHYGFGKHIENEGDFGARLTASYYWFKIFYIYESLYTIAVTACKYSILIFYSRIFKEGRFKIALWATFGLVTAWFIAIETAVLAECTPIHALWDFTPGKCIDLTKFLVAAGVPNILLNTVVLILPLPMIWSLEIEKKHKWALSSVFMLGGFIVVVSIVRVVILARIQQVDITWTFVPPGIWTSVEPCIAICSACLPILRSLWVWRRRQPSIAHSNPKQMNRSLSNSNKSSKPATDIERIGSFTSHYPLNELSTEGELPWGNHVSIKATRKKSQHSEESDIHMNDLPIQREDSHEEVSETYKHKRKSSSLSQQKQVAELYG